MPHPVFFFVPSQLVSSLVECTAPYARHGFGNVDGGQANAHS